MQSTWQFIDAGHQGRRAGTLGDQVEGGSRPGVGMRSLRAGGPHMPPGPQQPGGQGSPFTVPVPGPPGGCPGSIPPQILIQAMRTIGLADRAQESLSLEEWNNIHIFLRAVMQPRRQLGMAATRIASGGNPIIPGASEPGSSGPQRRVQGPNFLQQQHFPAPEEMLGQPNSQREDLSTNSSSLERKRPRRGNQSSSGPTLRFAPGARGANGMPAEQPMPRDAANPRMMRPPSQANPGQAMNPIMANKGPPGSRAKPLRVQEPVQPGPQRFTLPTQDKPGGLVFNSYTDGLPITITDLEIWASNNNSAI
ncbi:hypothetical protein M407DRAFT_17122 [Tulasnella calospora MUT 4182]|uniref:Uncharacterized protein n=1 Tax=Tulasnella calospora MUT 4182 TaxID=1051891 RepID=A0A0C3MKG4_9AGAM|nr:hypothetical protein M407DRAFT_17122 [Tulasnella calospora MUT 4182]